LGHERRFRNIREESAHTPTTDVKPQATIVDKGATSGLIAVQLTIP